MSMWRQHRPRTDNVGGDVNSLSDYWQDILGLLTGYFGIIDRIFWAALPFPNENNLTFRAERHLNTYFLLFVRSEDGPARCPTPATFERIEWFNSFVVLWINPRGKTLYMTLAKYLGTQQAECSQTSSTSVTKGTGRKRLWTPSINIFH